MNNWNEEKRNKIGIDFKHLNLFKCLACKGDLILLKGNIDKNQVMDGILKCDCGMVYHIEDGILITNDERHDNGFIYDTNYVEKYISSTDIQYLDNIYKNLSLVCKKLDFNNFKDKTILELGSGVGFFLRSIYRDLPDNATYIAVDHDLGRHKFLKGILELIDIHKDIVFICSDFTKIPIQDQSIDILVDISGSSNYAFNNERFLLKEMDDYVKEFAYLIGSYIIFKNFSVNSKIDDKYRKNFILNHIKEEIKSLNYKPIYDKPSTPLVKGGRYEDYFVKGEEVYYYLYYGTR